MKELIESKGWIFYYKCDCGGSWRYHYYNPINPGYEIRIRPENQSFTILRTGRVIAGPSYSYKLEDKMKSFGL